MKQPIPKIKQRDVERIIQRDYPEEEQDNVISILSEYKSRTPHRVQMSALKNSDGNVQNLKQQIELANTDFRDVIMPAEYPMFWEKVGFDSDKFSKQQLKEIIELDWNQYQSWLNE